MEGRGERGGTTSATPMVCLFRQETRTHDAIVTAHSSTVTAARVATMWTWHAGAGRGEGGHPTGGPGGLSRANWRGWRPSKGAPDAAEGGTRVARRYPDPGRADVGSQVPVDHRRSRRSQKKRQALPGHVGIMTVQWQLTHLMVAGRHREGQWRATRRREDRVISERGRNPPGRRPTSLCPTMAPLTWGIHTGGTRMRNVGGGVRAHLNDQKRDGGAPGLFQRNQRSQIRSARPRSSHAHPLPNRQGTPTKDSMFALFASARGPREDNGRGGVPEALRKGAREPWQDSADQRSTP
jgi:hypothetical protein